MDKEALIDLFKRYRNNACTPEEAELLFRHIKSGKGKRLAERLIESGFDTLPDGAVESVDEVKAILDRVYARVQTRKGRSSLAVVFRRRILPYAAAILVLLLAGLVWNWYQSDYPSDSPLQSAYGGDALPGGNQATLTLADGRTVVLSSDQFGVVVGGGITYHDGTPVLVSEGAHQITEGTGTETMQYMTLSTPYGGEYQITLSDGTRVWLNAASTLRYPSRFDGPERVVELEGEAYFEVRRLEPAESRHTGRRGANGVNPAAMVPFVVKTASQVVEVLGTEFNTSAYPGEPDTRTTLVGGTVRVKNVESQASSLLMPGQQVVVRGQDTDLNQVDVEVYTAWKDNVFIFERLELSRVLRQLERWYNVEFSYGQLPQATLSGEIPRNVPLSSVLAMIEGATAMSFEIQRLPADGQERRVVIMK